MPHHANGGSFKPGHKRSPETIAQHRATMRAKYKGGWVTPGKGRTWSDSQREQHAATKRRNAVGRRWQEKKGVRADGSFIIYWVVMTEEGRRYEHRVVLARTLGRKLLRTEIVHHKDHDGLNNHPDNLELLGSHAEHNKHHIAEGREVLDGFKSAYKLPTGRWSHKHEACVLCGLNDSPHASKGRCKRCHQKIWVKEQKAKGLR